MANQVGGIAIVHKLRNVRRRTATLTIHRSDLLTRSKHTSVEQALSSLIEGRDLTMEEAEQSLNLILDSGSSEQIAAFLVLLAAKGVPCAFKDGHTS
jgi:hypothetical protein